MLLIGTAYSAPALLMTLPPEADPLLPLHLFVLPSGAAGQPHQGTASSLPMYIISLGSK